MSKTIFGKNFLMLATITVLVAGLTFTATLNDAEAKKAKNADVSVWDSSVSIDLVTGIFPVGGSGQIDGNFAVDTKTKKDTAIQVGLRAQERLVGPITPFGNVYIVPTGESAPDRRAWNFDFSMDAGSDFLETQLGKDLTSFNLEDFTVLLEIKDAEKNKFEFDFDLGGVNANPVGPIVLSQQSWNIGFGFIDIPVDSEVYKISLTVLEDNGKKEKKIAKSKITVLVTDQVPEDGKLDICHKEETISVSVKSVAKHIKKHGDTIGECVSPNTPPTVESVTLTQGIFDEDVSGKIASFDNPINCIANDVNDVDGDDVTLSFEWTDDDGMLISSESIMPAFTPPFPTVDTVTCTVTPFDGKEFGMPVSQSTTLINTGGF